MISRAIVYCQFDFVGFVNLEFVQFIGPPISLGRFRSSLEDVLHFDYHECVRSSAKSSGSGMIDICHGVDANGEMSSQGFALARHTQAIICAARCVRGWMKVEGWVIYLPSGVLESSMSM